MLSNFTIVHHCEGEHAYVSKWRSVYSIGSDGKSSMVVKLPWCFPRDMSFGIRLLERLLRSDKCMVRPVGNVLLIIRNGVVYFFDCKLHRISNVSGDCPLHASVAVIGERAYFGEYFMNPERMAVRIYKVDSLLRSCSVVYEFKAGEIRHVHGTYVDTEVAGRIWVTTGDLNGECNLYWTDDEFLTLHKVGDGSQPWRAVGLMFTKDYVCWGSDSPHVANYFYRMNRLTQSIERGQFVPGTVWYSGKTSDGMYYASSSVEKGPGVITNRASVWISVDAWNWTQHCSFIKDILPMPLFKWGTISFPSGLFCSKNVWISGEALTGLDGVSCSIDLNSPSV